MEEGEVDEVSFTGKGNLNEAARAIVSILKQQLLSNLKKQLQCIYIQHSLKNIDIIIHVIGFVKTLQSHTFLVTQTQCTIRVAY